MKFSNICGELLFDISPVSILIENPYSAIAVSFPFASGLHSTIEYDQ